VQEGQILGKVDIQLRDETLLSRDLVALSAAQAGSFWSRLVDTIKLFFIRLFD
jgi:D-alanyl-D-alanine carboxypeptidase (penicillin-binding protein 5/6)